MVSSFLLAAALAAAPCAAQADQGPTAPRCDPAGPNWRTLATEDDRRRFRNWRDAWTEALTQARAAGPRAEIASAGVLLDPDAALTGPAPPPGDYDCRTIKLGSQAADGGLAFVAYTTFLCRIVHENGSVTFTKLTGSQRPIGRLFPDIDRRMVFLGTMQLGDERRSHQYGIDEERDMVGLLERIAGHRWRLVFPYPHFESLLDVIELTPRNSEQERNR